MMHMVTYDLQRLTPYSTHRLSHFHNVDKVHASPETYSHGAARHRLPPMHVMQADMAPNDALINTEMATNSLGLVTTDIPLACLINRIMIKQF